MAVEQQEPKKENRAGRWGCIIAIIILAIIILAFFFGIYDFEAGTVHSPIEEVNG